MRTQRVLGRAQVRYGRISRKAKRGIVREDGRIRLASSQTPAASVTVTKAGAVVHSDYVRNSQGDLIARVRNRVTQEGLDAIVRQAIGGDRMTERHGGLGEVECQYVGPRTQLTVQLRDGGSSYNRKCLRQSAERKGFRYRSVYGPQCWEDDTLNVVVVKLHSEFDEKLVRVLRAGGWQQCDTDRRKFTLPATRHTRLYAADFCHMHAGDWFTLSGVKTEVVEMLRHGTSWSYPLSQATIAVAGSGTTEHMKFAHQYRKPKSRNKLHDGLEQGMNVRGKRTHVTDPIEMVHRAAKELKLPPITHHPKRQRTIVSVPPGRNGQGEYQVGPKFDHALYIG